ANSDPAVIKLADRWIRRLTTNHVYYTFQFHADQDPAQLIAFWSAELGAEPELFRFQRKSNSGALNGRNWRCAHGVLSVVCNDTYLRSRLQAWMDRVCESWLDSPHGAQGSLVMPRTW